MIRMHQLWGGVRIGIGIRNPTLNRNRNIIVRPWKFESLNQQKSVETLIWCKDYEPHLQGV